MTHPLDKGTDKAPAVMVGANHGAFSPRAFRIAEICSITGLGRTTIYAAIRAGDLIARKCGRRTIVLADDLSEWLASLPRTREPTT